MELRSHLEARTQPRPSGRRHGQKTQIWRFGEQSRGCVHYQRRLNMCPKQITLLETGGVCVHSFFIVAKRVNGGRERETGPVGAKRKQKRKREPKTRDEQDRQTGRALICWRECTLTGHRGMYFYNVHARTCHLRILISMIERYDSRWSGAHPFREVVTSIRKHSCLWDDVPVCIVEKSRTLAAEFPAFFSRRT